MCPKLDIQGIWNHTIALEVKNILFLWVRVLYDIKFHMWKYRRHWNYVMDSIFIRSIKAELKYTLMTVNKKLTLQSLVIRLSYANYSLDNCIIQDEISMQMKNNMK